MAVALGRQLRARPAFVVIPFALALAACGGGSAAAGAVATPGTGTGGGATAGGSTGDAGAGTGAGTGTGTDTGGAGTGTTAPVAAGVFAAPSGPLCATRRQDGLCTEPTASAVSAEQLFALQQNAAGERFAFNVIGVEHDAYQELGSIASELVVTNSSMTYSPLEKVLTLGANQLTEDGLQYSFDSVPSAYSLKYTAGENQALLTAMPPSMLPLVLARNVAYERVVPTMNVGGRQGDRTWQAALGPLTDSALAPSEATVTFTGMLHVMAGDGSPVPTGEKSKVFGHFVSGSCPVTVSFSPGSGSLVVAPVQCTALVTQAVIHFTLAPLTISASRVSGALGIEASIQLEGPSAGIQTGLPGSGATLEPTSVTFQTAHISGAVYGAGATGVAVSGAGAAGHFILYAYRQWIGSSGVR